jgi:hypothetical protein
MVAKKMGKKYEKPNQVVKNGKILGNETVFVLYMNHDRQCKNSINI